MIFKANCLSAFLLLILSTIKLGTVVESTGTGESDDERDHQQDDDCNKSQFECYSGKCIDVLDTCNGVRDCKDGRDETESTCDEFANSRSCGLNLTIPSRFDCEFKGIPVTCAETVAVWTTVKIQCNVGYVPSKNAIWRDQNKCLPSGEWLYPMPSCTYDCGVTYLANDTYIDVDGKTLRATNYPWVVIIVFKIEGTLKQACFGTLITPFTIITALNCTRYSGKYLKEKDLIILMGKMEIINKLIDITNFQRFKVKSINRNFKYYEEVNDNLKEKNDMGDLSTELYDGSSIDESFYSSEKPDIHGRTKQSKTEQTLDLNLATLTLAIHTGVYLEEVAMPVCINNSNKSQLISETDLKGISLDGQFTQKMQFLFHDECETYLRSDKWENISDHQQLMKHEFCGYFPGENGTMIIDTGDRPLIAFGTGITGSSNGKHFLIGIATRYIPLKSKKNGEHYTVLVITDVRGRKDLSFKTTSILLKNIIDADNLKVRLSWKRPQKGGCGIPYSSGTKFLEKRCTANSTCYELQTYSLINELSVVFFQCQENYTMKGRINHRLCLNGKWIPRGPTCVRTCDPLPFLPSIKTYCNYEGKNVSCSERVIAGTIATSTCESEGFNKESYNNTCLHSGNWQDSPGIIEIICIDLCGILKVETPLVENGEEANNTLHPWNAALYVKDDYGDYNHVCGGTLISKYAVVSAAHCVQSSSGKRHSADILKVGLAKFYREFTHAGDSDAQFIEVKYIHIPNVYEGPLSSFIFDIMILELKEAATLNEVVVPACIDTKNKFILTSSSVGGVVGWGFNGTGKEKQQTDTLMKAVLPYIDRDTCVKNYQNLFNLKITKDKFCAFHLEADASKVRGGDSGSGLTFKFRKRHYIYGLVSLQSNETVSMFTNITHPVHLQFINKILNIILENN